MTSKHANARQSPHPIRNAPCPAEPSSPRAASPNALRPDSVRTGATLPDVVREGRARPAGGRSVLQSQDSFPPVSPLPYLVVGVGILAAVVEFLALRFLIRLGPMLPEAARGDVAAALTGRLILFGTVAQNLALLLTLALLALIGWHNAQISLKGKSLSGLRRAGRGQAALTGSLALTVVLFVAHTLAGPTASPLLYTAFLLATFSAMVTALWAVDCPCQRPAWLALFCATYLLVLYPTLGATLALPLPFVPAAHALAEIGAVLAACLAPLALRPRFDWRALGVATATASLLAGMWISISWLPPTLMIWTVAFTGFLPAPFYIAALGFFLYALLALTFNGGERATPVPAVVLGLTLIALGGLRWDFSYYVLLGLLGFLIVSGVHQSKISGDQEIRG
jgi:hypothetical protein